MYLNDRRVPQIILSFFLAGFALVMVGYFTIREV
jgi:hypothetical protein